MGGTHSPGPVLLSETVTENTGAWASRFSVACWISEVPSTGLGEGCLGTTLTHEVDRYQDLNPAAAKRLLPIEFDVGYGM